MNFVVWSKLFFDWQFKDYNPSKPTSQIGKTNVLLQDNTSAIQLERYGKRSSTKRTRHILVQYFYVTDKLQDRILTAISYCLTKEMVNDYLSKSLQGSLFRTHRNAIMGINEQDEAESFNAYKMQLERKKSNGWARSLFSFYFMFYFFFKTNLFLSILITVPALCFAECVEKYLFFILFWGTPNTSP